ncbi:RNase H-like domain-containing protein, partial [Enterococcus faecalis]|uniref:RNase H-like domain-containing protein n=1 Tax=Enterococcus faecalis TaxID=1351 RepID=UPI0034DCF9F7
LQKGKPVSYASVTLTPTQQSYAQIEKELLAIVCACEHFHFYLYGATITIETDHKPLVNIVKKAFALLSPRIQKMLLRL